MRSFATILLALSLPLHAFAAHAVNLRRHADIALHPRQSFQGAATFYDITTGMYVYLLLYPHRPLLIRSLQYSLWWKLRCK
jgi:hypothetical protein